MDHVINSLRSWLDTFKEVDPDDKKAIKCIEKAIKELNKYYDFEEGERRG